MKFINSRFLLKTHYSVLLLFELRYHDIQQRHLLFSSTLFHATKANYSFAQVIETYKHISIPLNIAFEKFKAVINAWYVRTYQLDDQKIPVDVRAYLDLL